mgnify:CR=1 FL=1
MPFTTKFVKTCPSFVRSPYIEISSFILIVYDVLLVFLLRYEGFMPDRYWDWVQQGYNEYKIKIVFSLIYLAYSAMVGFVYRDELKPLLPENFQ